MTFVYMWMWRCVDGETAAAGTQSEPERREARLDWQGSARDCQISSSQKRAHTQTSTREIAVGSRSREGPPCDGGAGLDDGILCSSSCGSIRGPSPGYGGGSAERLPSAGFKLR